MVTMAVLLIPVVAVPVVKAVAVGVGAAVVAVAGWFGFRKANPEEVPVQSQQPQKPAAKPAPSLMSKVAEVKQAVRERIEVASEKVAEKVEQVKEFIAKPPECVRKGFRRLSKAATAQWMRLALQWSGLPQRSDVEPLQKVFLKSPPLIRAPSQPLFTA